MKRLLARLTVVVAVVTALAQVSATTAYAQAAGAGVVQGAGTISPGLSLTPTNQTVSFSGTVAGAFAGVPGVGDVGNLNCTFSGASTIQETDLQGQGTVSGTCDGTGIATGKTITVTCNVMVYIRILATVIVQARCTLVIKNVPSGVVTLKVDVDVRGHFVFIPTTVNPVTSYRLAGVASAVGI